MNLGDDPHLCSPIQQEDGDVYVITEDTDGMNAVRCCLQRVAAECEVYLSMGDDRVQLFDELDVVWKGGSRVGCC